MSNRILAVHLTAERLCVATAQSTLRTLRVDTILDIERDRAMNLGRLLPKGSWDRVVATLPSEAGSFRFLDFAFRDTRRLEQAVGPALEEHIPFDLEDCLAAWDFLAANRRENVLGLLVPRTSIDEQRELLAKFGVCPQRFVWTPCVVLEFYRRVLGTTTDYTIVDLSRDGAVVATLVQGKLIGLRTVGNCPDDVLLRHIVWSLRTIAPPSPRVVLGGSKVQDLAPRLADALPEFRLEALPDHCPVELTGSTSAHWTTAAPAIGLLYAATGDLGRPGLEIPVDPPAGEAPAPGLTWQTLRPLAPWAAVAVTLVTTAIVADYSRLAGRKHGLEQRAQAVFHQAMPAAAAGSGLRLKLEMRLKELERRSRQSSGAVVVASPLEVLSSMSRAIPSDLAVEFDSYVYDPPNIRMSGQGSSFETVTRVQELLQERDEVESVEVRDVRAAVNGDGVEFRLTIRLAQAGDST